MKGGATFPVRMRFSEVGKVAWISHRDAARAFERAFRICELPLAFSVGFSPRPKVSFGLALSVGMSSRAEYLDVEFAEPVDLETLPERLNAALPEGLSVTGVARLAERAPALQEAVSEVAYEAVVLADGIPVSDVELKGVIAEADARPTLEAPRTRKGRTVIDDIKPALRQLDVTTAEDGTAMLVIACGTKPSVRPGEVLAAVAPQWHLGHVQRTHQWIERNGMRLDPLTADAHTGAAQERAS